MLLFLLKTSNRNINIFPLLQNLSPEQYDILASDNIRYLMHIKYMCRGKNIRTEIFNPISLFKYIYSSGNLILYEHIFNKFPYINDTSYKTLNNQNTSITNFITACSSGNLEICKFLVKKFPNFNIHKNNEYIFKKCCHHGHIHVIEWIIKKFPDINVHVENEYIFRVACENGNLLVAKLLIDNFPDIDVHACNDKAFRYSCKNGHLETSKWLINRFPDIDIHIYEDYAFHNSCWHGHIDTCKWLCDIIPDIRINGDNYLKNANVRKHFELIRYICDLNPYYEYDYDIRNRTHYVIKEYLNIKKIKQNTL